MSLFLDKLFPRKMTVAVDVRINQGEKNDDSFAFYMKFRSSLRELCVVADEVAVPGSSTFYRSSSELLVSV